VTSNNTTPKEICSKCGIMTDQFSKACSCEEKYMVNEHLKELKDTWDYTTEELNHIKQIMAQYAMEAAMDSKVFKEVKSILEADSKEC
jgi:hypothetical protein